MYTLENHLDIRHMRDKLPGDGLEVGTRPASCADVHALRDSHSISADRFSARENTDSYQKASNCWPRRRTMWTCLLLNDTHSHRSPTSRPPCSHRWWHTTACRLPSRPRCTRRIPYPGTGKGSGRAPRALCLQWRSELERQRKHGSTGSTSAIRGLTLKMSAMRIQRHRRVICNGEHKRASADSVRGRWEGQSTQWVWLAT